MNLAERLVTVAELNAITIANRRVQAEYAAALADRLGLTPKVELREEPDVRIG